MEKAGDPEISSLLKNSVTRVEIFGWEKLEKLPCQVV
jgi:hypothetical protein